MFAYCLILYLNLFAKFILSVSYAQLLNNNVLLRIVRKLSSFLPLRMQSVLDFHYNVDFLVSHSPVAFRVSFR